MKRLYHPLHGYHYPWGAAHEAHMRANGWTDEPVEPVKVEPAQVEPEPQAEPSELPPEAQPEKRKPGRPRKQ